MADVANTVSELGLFAVQLHGDESQAYVNELKQSLPESVEDLEAYGVACGAEARYQITGKQRDSSPTRY
ncbi:hypothetical protein O9929_19855 [Vibrio lentus]|nr:hypothetical protein [Vibrio lentus]